MASNPKWTRSLSRWKSHYKQWVQEAVPESVMNIAALYDCRYIYGEKSLMDELRVFLDGQLRQPLDRFLYQMADNALQHEPPWNFFGYFSTFKKGSQKVINIKRVMTPIVDLVRVYALHHRIFKTNTGERLEALTNKGVFSDQEYQELRT